MEDGSRSHSCSSEWQFIVVSGHFFSGQSRMMQNYRMIDSRFQRRAHLEVGIWNPPSASRFGIWNLEFGICPDRSGWDLKERLVKIKKAP
jgi:hypothetical protein